MSFYHLLRAVWNSKNIEVIFRAYVRRSSQKTTSFCLNYFVVIKKSHNEMGTNPPLIFKLKLQFPSSCWYCFSFEKAQNKTLPNIINNSSDTSKKPAQLVRKTCNEKRTSVCVYSLIFHSSGHWAQDLWLLQVDFANWMLFQSFILCERWVLIKRSSLETP